MKKTIRAFAAKTAACLLVLCMLASVGGVTAYAGGLASLYETGVDVDGSQNPVEVGDVTVDMSNDRAIGVAVESSSGTGGGEQYVSTGNVSVTINADDGYSYEGVGLYLEEGNNAVNSIETGSITVSVSAEDEGPDASGIKVSSDGGEHHTTLKTGEIKVTAGTASDDTYGSAVGIDVYQNYYDIGDNSSIEIAVDGNVTVHNALTEATGIKVFNSEGKNNSVRLAVNGDVSATMDTDDQGESSHGLILETIGTSNSTEVVVDGNVTTDREGGRILTLDGGTLDLVVTGTISGRNVGIAFDDDTDASKTSVTTWKIDSKGPLVDDMYGELGSAGITNLAKQVIHYIVKLVQPDQGDILKAVKADGSALNTKTYKVSDDKGEQTVSTENEGEIVRLTLSDDRYEIVSAENVDGTQLSKDEQGFYYSVTRGGGILLSAVLREKLSPEPDPKPQPEPDPKPQPKPQPKPSGGSDSVGGEAWGIKIIYELDGGLYRDDPGPIIRYCMPGQLIHLLDAPEKEGFEFGGWYREIDDKIETYDAGDDFRPLTTVIFTAIWNE